MHGWVKSVKVILSLRGSLMTLSLKSLKCEEKRRMCGGEKHSFTLEKCSLIVSGNTDMARGLLTMAGDHARSSRPAHASSQLANDMFMT